MKLSLVMIIKNEERSLKHCLENAAPLVDEIIIVDTGSSDCSKQIAQKAGAKVLDFTWCDDFSAARNFSLMHSGGDWNLILDADEILRPCSRKELENAILSLTKKYGKEWMGAITRYDIYRDNGQIETSVTALPRFLPPQIRYKGMIHEQPDCNFPCFRLPLSADHDGYLFTGKGERNLSYLQRAVAKEPKDGYFRFQLGATLRNMGQLLESLEQFRAFYHSSSEKDGYWTEGILLYLYTLLDLGGLEHLLEAWKVIEKAELCMQGRSDYWFVCGLFYMKLVLCDTASYISYLPKIEESYLKCLAIGENPALGGVVGTGSFKAAYNLGLWYEVSGQREKAVFYYQMAAAQGYQPAKLRIGK